MLLYTLTAFFFISTAMAAALHPGRQASPLDSLVAQQACSFATVYSYLTTTVTHVPPTVTIAVPDYSSISRSLASVSTIDSLVVVENSINRPADAPPNTVVPTFIHTINAPAVEATEAPHSGTSVVFLPITKSPHTVAIGTVTESIVISPFGQPASSRSTAQVEPLQNKNFTLPVSGWNGTDTNATVVSPVTGAGPTASQSISSTFTQITYVSTTTYVTNDTVTPTLSYNSPPQYSDSGYDGYSSYDGYSGNIKRQTCVIVSAQIGGHWASWCNNWDGSTTYPYTSWETTIIPGTVQERGSSVHPTLPASSALATAAPAQIDDPSPCGQTGAFTISFDNLPSQSDKDPAHAGRPLIIDPFEHFFWAEGWSWMPPPSGPYSPHSGKQLAIWVPPVQSGFQPPSFPTANLKDLPLGGFGAAQRSPIDAYWFNIRSAWVGCDNNITNPLVDICEFYAQGYVYDEHTQAIQPLKTPPAYFTKPLCHSETCQLTEIFFSDEFSGLSAINFYAKAGGQIVTFYMDDLELTWYNNTCEAGRLRASTKK